MQLTCKRKTIHVRSLHLSVYKMVHLHSDPPNPRVGPESGLEGWRDPVPKPYGLEGPKRL